MTSLFCSFEQDTPRRPVNPRPHSVLAAQARAKKLNLPAIAEVAVRRAVAERAAERPSMSSLSSLLSCRPRGAVPRR